ncbi:hypothetical protein, partial [Undibacterium sp. TJN19]|uniref:hypothetical protein n=1 Tax=Undibacterium sp. TJN19 TaxID=3413055 RepID=UPI003BF459E6
IPNRTVKRLRANDSAATSVKVGYRQACIPHTPDQAIDRGFCFCACENNQKKKASNPLNVGCAARTAILIDPSLFCSPHGSSTNDTRLQLALERRV